MTTLLAQCSNCAAWRLASPTGHATTAEGFCAKGLHPDEGQPLCRQYEASAAFRNQIIGTILREGGPMALPVKLVGGRKGARKPAKGKP